MTTKDEKGWNLYQRRGDGQWVLQYRVRVGEKWPEHRVPREHRSERQAERYALRWLQAYRQEMAERPAPPPEAERGKTIRDLAGEWEKLCDKNPKLSPATRKQHATNLAVHVLAYPEVADVPIAELGPATLRAWVRKVRDDGKITIKWETEGGRSVRRLVRGGPLAPFTCRNAINSLTAFFADVMVEAWGVDLPANPMKHPGVRREVPDAVTLAGKHCIIHLTRPVADKLLTSAELPEWRRVRLLLALTSGMPGGELCGLQGAEL